MCQRPSLRTPKCGLTQFSARRAQAKPRPCPSPPDSAHPDGGSRTRPTRALGWRPAWRAPAGARAPPCHPDGTRGPERRRDPEGHGCGQATSPRGAWSCRRFTDSAPDSPSGVERSRNKPTAALATCQRGRRAGVARPRRAARRALRPAGDRGARGTAGPAPGLTRPAGPRRPLWTTRPPPRRASGC